MGWNVSNRRRLKRLARHSVQMRPRLEQHGLAQQGHDRVQEAEPVPDDGPVVVVVIDESVEHVLGREPLAVLDLQRDDLKAGAFQRVAQAPASEGTPDG